MGFETFNKLNELYSRMILIILYYDVKKIKYIYFWKYAGVKIIIAIKIKFIKNTIFLYSIY